ncbi:aldo/keto reductase [Micromonospora endophytica]|uniref:Aldo/keto reductase n=1 Tax=Micromonospora endophytica TaxID=515350 RepID=A0A2W2C4K4_9ACTN|nr:aldo/keto reductase [Micromonospora endophytica]PZF93482.1 aldo/keto reductase [Micromonospora endophytica]RIW41444.1 aldo/keto reductase [Micromonospora endophytica]BCJ58285.1 oxidoreductase [Micromonospora endophytica]
MDHADHPVAVLPGDVRIPLLGFGTWQATGEAGFQAVLAALDAGYRHIDTATMYGNEKEVGRAVRESGLRREDVFITTKLPPERVGRERETIEESLRALDTEYVDLWLVHWPPSEPGDLIPAWREMIAVREAGLARAVGVSNFSTLQIDELIQATEENPAVNQIKWGPHLYDRQRHAEHRDRGVVLEGYSPFKATDLADPVLAGIASAHNVSPAQVVLRWHIDHEIVVIPKSVTPERIRANADVFGFSLTAEEIRDIDALGQG